MKFFNAIPQNVRISEIKSALLRRFVIIVTFPWLIAWMLGQSLFWLVAGTAAVPFIILWHAIVDAIVDAYGTLKRLAEFYLEIFEMSWDSLIGFLRSTKETW